MHRSVKWDIDVPVEMRDGTVLRANVLRPDDSSRHPAILFRTAYDKNRFVHSDMLSFTHAALAGYAIVIQDIRGRFASEGEWDRNRMFEVEGPDGYDTVEWIAAQPWCDGNVGMAGGSYLAAMTWITAMEAPPHLKAISPWIGDINTMLQPPPESGAVTFYTAASALPETSVNLVAKLESQGMDVSGVKEFLQNALADPQLVIRQLPLNDIPLARFEPIREMWHARLNPVPLKEQERRKRYENIVVPAFHIGGWFDQFEWATFRNFRQMRSRGGSPAAREGQYVLVGPWMHGRVLSWLGDYDFGSSGGNAFGVHAQTLTFFDKYLRGIEADIPRVKYFVMSANRWKTADDWPPPETEWHRYYLHSGGRANTAGGDGVLSRDEPGSEAPDRFVYDPLDPVPTVGGRVIAVAGIVPGPLEQSFVERREDVLCYTSEELKEDVEVSGPIQLRLFASTSAVDTDFTAKLTDVYPDGRSYNVAEGIQRARYRNRDGQPSPVVPGQIYEYVIDLGNTSNLFRKGHRIRIQISSSNFPLYDRNMNTGNPPGSDAEGIKAIQTVYHEPGFASYIDLPVIPTRFR